MSKKTDRATFLENIGSIESIESNLNDAYGDATLLEELSSSSFLDKEQLAALHDLVQLLAAADTKISEITSLFVDEIEDAHQEQM